MVVFDKNKSNKALKEVQEILSENNSDFEVYDEQNKTTSYQDYDLVLVIGGDGSMLSAAKLFSHINCPFLGVNLGKVGFMADLDYGSVDQNLIEVLKGNCLPETKETIDCIYNGKSYTFFNR